MRSGGPSGKLVPMSSSLMTRLALSASMALGLLSGVDLACKSSSSPTRKAVPRLSLVALCPGQPFSDQVKEVPTVLKVVDPDGKTTLTCSGCRKIVGSHGSLTGPVCATKGWFTRPGSYRFELDQGGDTPAKEGWRLLLVLNNDARMRRFLYSVCTRVQALLFRQPVRVRWVTSPRAVRRMF